MSYETPDHVQGPRKSVSNVRVIYDGGEDDAAIAQLDWNGEPGVGMRWNGNDERPLGNPQSRGHPVWWLVPPEFQEAILARVNELTPESPLAAGYREMAADSEREQEAEEWSELLLDDLSHASR